MAEALAKAGEQQYLETGQRVIFEALEDVKIDGSITPKSTEFHEACHALAAILLNVPLKSITVIPEGNTLGATHLGDYNPLVFAAAHAKGCDGTGHDLSVLKMVEGDTGAALDGAADLLSGWTNLMRILALATLLKKRREIGGNEAWALVLEFDKQEKEGKMYIIRVVNEDGTEDTKTERARDGEKVDLSDMPLLMRLERKEKKPKTTDGADIIVSGKLPVAANEN